MKDIFLRKLKELSFNLKEDHVSEASAQCAYYVILSFVPFIILLLTLIQYTTVSAEQLLEIISKVIPKNMSEIVVSIIREIYSKSIGTISISLIITLYSASRAFLALLKELHCIFDHIEENKKSWIYLKIRSLIQTILFLMLVIIGLIAMVFGKTILQAIKEKFRIFGNNNINQQIITYLIFFTGAFFVFFIMYKFLSNNKKNHKGQIIGAIFASITLNSVSYLFSIYLEIFKGFSITYGSLTSLILIMTWCYTCFYTVFLGAEINKLFKF